MRRIVVRGVTFLFKIGKADLFVRFPDGRMHHKDLSELMGLSQDNIDRGRWKKTSDGEVHPEDVARFICQELQVSLPGGEVPRSWYDGYQGGVGKSGSIRRPHKPKIRGSNPLPAT